MSYQNHRVEPQYDADGVLIRSIPADDRVVVCGDTAATMTDVQQAFMHDHVHDGIPTAGGGLAVKGGELIVKPSAELIQRFAPERRYAGRDVHRRGHIGNHTSFNAYVDPRLTPFAAITVPLVEEWRDDRAIKSRYFGRDYLLRYLERAIGNVQVLWWEHANDDTEQSELHPGVRDIPFRMVVTKGLDPLRDSYSPYQDNVRNSTMLGETQTEHGVKRIVTWGLAYDYCAGFGALDAAEQHQFQTYIVKDLCRSVNPASEKEMDRRLIAAGVHVITSDQLVFPAGG